MEPITLTKGNKKILITRTKFHDRYNYYLMKLNYSSHWKNWFVDDDFKQKETITSLKTAKEAANKALK